MMVPGPPAAAPSGLRRVFQFLHPRGRGCAAVGGQASSGARPAMQALANPHVAAAPSRHQSTLSSRLARFPFFTVSCLTRETVVSVPGIHASMLVALCLGRRLNKVLSASGGISDTRRQCFLVPTDGTVFGRALHSHATAESITFDFLPVCNRDVHPSL